MEHFMAHIFGLLNAILNIVPIWRQGDVKTFRQPENQRRSKAGHSFFPIVGKLTHRWDKWARGNCGSLLQCSTRYLTNKLEKRNAISPSNHILLCLGRLYSRFKERTHHHLFIHGAKCSE